MQNVFKNQHDVIIIHTLLKNTVFIRSFLLHRGVFTVKKKKVI